jgi:hypothetical protein
MKEIVRWAIVDDDNGTVYTSFSHEKEAVASIYTSTGRSIVKLTGQMPEPKKPRLLAPCLYNSGKGIWVSASLYESEQEAKAIWKDQFVSWPAVANKDGFYEVPA